MSSGISVNPSQLLRDVDRAIKHLDAALLSTTRIEVHPWTWYEIIRYCDTRTTDPLARILLGFPVTLNEDLPTTKVRISVDIETPLIHRQKNPAP